MRLSDLTLVSPGITCGEPGDFGALDPADQARIAARVVDVAGRLVMSNAKANAEQAAALLGEMLARSATDEERRSRVEQVVALYLSATCVLGREEAERITRHLQKQLEVLARDPFHRTPAAMALEELRGEPANR